MMTPSGTIVSAASLPPDRGSFGSGGVSSLVRPSICGVCVSRPFCVAYL